VSASKVAFITSNSFRQLEFWLNIHPVILGKGKRLFNDAAVPAAFEIVESKLTSTGVFMVNYKKAGEVKIGKAGPE